MKFGDLMEFEVPSTTPLHEALEERFHDTAYAVYKDGNKLVTSLENIRNSVDNPLVVKPYQVKVKTGWVEKFWKYSPLDNVETLLKRYRLDAERFMVTLGQDEIESNDRSPLLILLSSTESHPPKQSSLRDSVLP